MLSQQLLPPRPNPTHWWSVTDRLDHFVSQTAPFLMVTSETAATEEILMLEMLILR